MKKTYVKYINYKSEIESNFLKYHHEDEKAYDLKVIRTIMALRYPSNIIFDIKRNGGQQTIMDKMKPEFILKMIEHSLPPMM